MVKHVLIGIIPALFIFFGYIGYNVVPYLFMLIIGLAFYTLMTNNKNSLSALNSGQKNKSGHTVTKPDVRFEDVGGLKRVKKELTEALDFLIAQNAYASYGIRPIKGILLDGPPGTGKTLLAKAAANYTDSVFVAASGSEFVEMYVGVGAQRVRKLFNEARSLANKNHKNSAIVFIDEIDVIGGKRDGKSQREYDQTLNQLLTEMDGIKGNENPKVLVIAATNRKDMLDSALIRPGRFDRHINIDLPDKYARKKILEIHTVKKPLAKNVDLDQLALEAYGLSGAQLESVANEAAIYALRDKQSEITNKHFTNAIDKVLLGEQIDKEASRAEKRRVAIHELGHALVAELVKPGSVSQIALKPRGQALGYIRHNPVEEDLYLYTRDMIEQQIEIALAGALAEEIFYGNRSTGSKNDFDQALILVNKMIETGLTSLGIVDTNYVQKDKLAKESQEILELLLARTKKLLLSNKNIISEATTYLEKEEVLTGHEFRKIINKFPII